MSKIDFKDMADDPFTDPFKKLSSGNSSITTATSTTSLSSTTNTYQKRCYETHPAYEIAPGIKIYGGSCSYPIVNDADVYGGFDYGMHFKKSSYPWAPQADSGPIEFKFEISDMRVPKNEVEFAKMITWLAGQLASGQKVHLGCIGGHGRTGLVLAALHKHMTGDADAIRHVRENYCKKAVESSEQVEWLGKHWGIKSAPATKSWDDWGSSSGKGSSTKKTQLSLLNGSSSSTKRTGKPMHHEASVWGRNPASF